MTDTAPRPLKRRRTDTFEQLHGASYELDTPNSTRVETWVSRCSAPAAGAVPILPTTPPSERIESDNDNDIDHEYATQSDSGTAKDLAGRATRQLSHVQIPRPSLTAAAYIGWEPTEPVTVERRAVRKLLKKLEPEDGSMFIELKNFTIYRPGSSRRPLEMCTLDRLQIANGGVDELCFSGKLSTLSGKSYNVHDVPFSVLTIEGYGDDCPSVNDKICIQSPTAGAQDVWYRLCNPSVEYAGFYEPFLWLANFTKFFIDFLLKEKSVTLQLFKAKFAGGLLCQHGCSALFQSWHDQCGLKKDFRTSVASYTSFLYKETYSIDSSLLQHPIWRETYPTTLNAIKAIAPMEQGDATIVSPLVFRCFKDMYFSSHLAVKKPSERSMVKIQALKRELCLTPWDAAPTVRPTLHVQDQPLDIRSGDVVCIHPDEKGDWRHSTANMWYAYVQCVREDKSGSTIIDVLWLYESEDTTLGNAYYPFPNELFLSDICDCGKSALPIEDAVAKLDVAWFETDPNSARGFFVRQKYYAKEEEDLHSFVTLNSSDFRCAHARQAEEKTTDVDTAISTYRVGDNILMHSKHDPLLQPARVLGFDYQKRRFLVQKFNKSVDPQALPNEITESSEEVFVASAHIIRHCKVGYFVSRHDVATPYNRGGSGDHFFVLEDAPSPLSMQTPPFTEEERELLPTQQPLVGLGLYCGGGNFDRGLEEGGAVNFQYAVDWDDAALHSYRANVSEPEEVQYFLGSVNDYLYRAMRGSKNTNIAPIGKIGVVSAGSPCPGFSAMQPDKQSYQSLKFASMVASVVAFVDIYNPQYLVLENVVTMAHKMVVDGKEQNVFGQILAALVSLGYQVQQFLMDAWSHGSCQSRSRVFIVASAPGTTPLVAPPRTHAHPPGPQIKKTLGKTTNGLSFCIRRDDDTPFKHVDAEQATQDLPDIGDSLPQICPRFPDHRTHADESQKVRQRLARVPIQPYGMGLCRAVRKGRIESGEAFEWVNACKGIRAMPGSKSYTRIRPDGLIPTVLTAFHLQCGINGRALHWQQHRCISIMEGRRAQGFLDHEVIVGTQSQQLKIVGNSVDRKVAFAMGLAIKDSLDATSETDDNMLYGRLYVDDEASFEQSDLQANEARASSETPMPPPSMPPASPEQIHAMKEESAVERAEGLKEVMRVLREKRRSSQAHEEAYWAVMDLQGHRWSGDAPGDTAAVQKLTSEVLDVL